MNKKEQTLQLKRLAIRIKAARHDAGLSQEVLAMKAGLDRSYMSRLERGLANPSYIAMIQLGKALNIPVTTLIE